MLLGTLQTQPQPTHTALQQSHRTTEMAMMVGRCRHGVIVAAPGCQGPPSTLPCRRRRAAVAAARLEGGSTTGRRRETEALRQPRQRRWRNGSALRREGCRRERHSTRQTGRASMPHAGPRQRHGRSRGQRGRNGDRGGSQGGRRTREGGGDAVVGGVAAAVDSNGEDDDTFPRVGIGRHMDNSQK
jgi:hypothetical protein